jgi:putative peptide zinc metalloprotease protein
MRYDGYYILADWIEVPNLRERCNRYLKTVAQEYLLGVEVQPEPYMELNRRVLFVTYAVASYIYRWVVTFGILIFLSKFLEPYKLESISKLMALAAAGSMVGWPAFRMIKAYRKRGRLPDMKSGRITATAAVVVAVVLFFFFVPLPVSRVRQTALVQPQVAAAEKVFVEIPGLLNELTVRDGQLVRQGEILATFRNLEMENQLGEQKSEYDIRVVRIRALNEQAEQTTDAAEKAKIEVALATAEGEKEGYARQVELAEERMRRLVVRAPRAGIVMSPPHIDEVGKLWEKDQATPFCTIGDWGRLQALMPVPPADYRLLKQDLAHDPNLAVTIRVQGRASATWKGHIAQMPEAEAKEVPVQLTSKGGGPLAVKPNTNPHVHVPQNQQYLVTVYFDAPDGAICPGTLAQVKVHCRWRSCAWWLWRTISSTFDLGLI